MKNKEFIPFLLDFFVMYLPDIKGVSKNTIIVYQYSFQLLFEFMNTIKGIPSEKISFANLSNGTVAESLIWLESKRGCSAMTRNHRRATIVSFAKYAVKKAFKEALFFYSEVNDIPRKKTPKVIDMKYFSKEEISCLLNLPNTTKKLGKRDAVLLSVLYSSGARAQEISDLTVNDISFGTTTIIKLVGKGNKARMIAIPQNCAILLKKYLKSVGLDSNNVNDRKRHVFSSQLHEKMTISCVEEIVKKYIKMAKNPSNFFSEERLFSTQFPSFHCRVYA